MIIDAIEEIKRLITLESCKFNEDYIAGVSDALDILEKYNDEYVVNREYYVLVKDNDGFIVIQKMRLYKINQTSNKITYCFTKLYKNGSVNADLILHSKGSMKIRVHETLDQAERNVLTYKAMK